MNYGMLSITYSNNLLYYCSITDYITYFLSVEAAITLLLIVANNSFPDLQYNRSNKKGEKFNNHPLHFLF